MVEAAELGYSEGERTWQIISVERQLSKNLAEGGSSLQGLSGRMARRRRGLAASQTGQGLACGPRTMTLPRGETRTVDPPHSPARGPGVAGPALTKRRRSRSASAATEFFPWPTCLVYLVRWFQLQLALVLLDESAQRVG